MPDDLRGARLSGTHPTPCCGCYSCYTSEDANLVAPLVSPRACSFPLIGWNEGHHSEPRLLCGVSRPMADQQTPDFWRVRGEEVRARAAETRDPEARRTMLQIAIMYHLMALRSERRQRETARRPTSFVAWVGRHLSGSWRRGNHAAEPLSRPNNTP